MDLSRLLFNFDNKNRLTDDEFAVFFSFVKEIEKDLFDYKEYNFDKRQVIVSPDHIKDCAEKKHAISYQERSKDGRYMDCVSFYITVELDSVKSLIVSIVTYRKDLKIYSELTTEPIKFTSCQLNFSADGKLQKKTFTFKNQFSRFWRSILMLTYNDLDKRYELEYKYFKEASFIYYRWFFNKQSLFNLNHFFLTIKALEPVENYRIQKGLFTNEFVPMEKSNLFIDQFFEMPTTELRQKVSLLEMMNA